MKIVQINTTCSTGSTGKICAAVSNLLTERGIENYVLYSSGYSNMPNSIRYNNDLQIKIGAFSSRLLGNWGFEGSASTLRLITILDDLKPDIIHLHNIHTHACRLDLLFRWIKQHGIRVLWTFHDCWAFTGYCMHYESAGCKKWESACAECPQRMNYTWLVDRSKALYQKKKKIFEGVDLTVIAPSEWMLRQVKKSFLKDQPVTVIKNGIDLSVFRPTDDPPEQLPFVPDRFTVLGVSNIWNEKKGINTFIRLSKLLDKRYRIVLIGVDESMRQRLPSEIIALGRTKSQSELAAYYSHADVFVNPTEEDTFPTVNIEALACGTPVVTFDTGGSPEIIDKTCGSVVTKNNIDELAAEIRRACETGLFSLQACLNRAANFDENLKFSEYIDLYESMK